MARRPVAVVAAMVLLAEAVGIVVINGILARFVEGQSMSLDGLDPDAMVIGTWALGVGSGLFLGACAVVCLAAGVRDRTPGGFARVLLTAAAVLHGLLGAVAVGLLGWTAFAFMMAVLGLIVLVLLSYGKRGPDARTNARTDARPGIRMDARPEDTPPPVTDGMAPA
ncbi:hypothetical protein [Streptomyces sp. NPDC004726]